MGFESYKKWLLGWLSLRERMDTCFPAARNVCSASTSDESQTCAVKIGRFCHGSSLDSTSFSDTQTTEMPSSQTNNSFNTLSRVRHLAHTLNLMAKSILKPFMAPDKQKKDGGGGTGDDFSAAFADDTEGESEEDSENGASDLDAAEDHEDDGDNQESPERT
ncbi:hypothetical protein FB45DRAFT_1032074 [Roridomyces roridus]|uniref:Uncharacterized protein n=1 Tax=Roridomyces roridus TaxID=1738132 RepID=A0AAD7FIU8_9AGAR|nr:hypothetical protein FB45DRAFT_1032074 [Roridomyces roridus]